MLFQFAIHPIFRGTAVLSFLQPIYSQGLKSNHPAGSPLFFPADVKTLKTSNDLNCLFFLIKNTGNHFLVEEKVHLLKSLMRSSLLIILRLGHVFLREWFIFIMFFRL